MKSDYPVRCRGFDMFFDDFDEGVLAQIARNMGGDCSFSANEDRVTYFFSKTILIDSEKVEYCHSIVSEVGWYFSQKYNCIYHAGELYLTVGEDFYEKNIDNLPEGFSIHLTKPLH